MPRRRVPEKRDIIPDPKFHNQTLAKFMNHVMVSGKKSVAEKIVYGAMDRIQQRSGGDPIEIFEFCRCPPRNYLFGRGVIGLVELLITP